MTDKTSTEVAGDAALSRSSLERVSKLHRQLVQESGLLLALVIGCVIFTWTATNFATQDNLLNILRQAAFTGIIAAGMTLVITAAEIDISVGAAVALTSALMGVLFRDTSLGMGLIILIVLIEGTVVGLFAGVARAKLNIPSFIVTLSLFLGLRGLAELITDTKTIPITSPTLDGLDGSVLGLPVPALVMAVVFAVIWFVAYRTTFGRSVFAIGGNPSAARLSGLKVDRVRILLFGLTGFLAALTGVLLTARIGNGVAVVGSGLEFEVIAAVIIGGTSLAGGRGTIIGTIIGVLFVTTLSNALVLYGVGSSAQNVVRGAIVLIAVLLTNFQTGLIRQKT